jgi:ribonuclease HI
MIHLFVDGSVNTKTKIGIGSYFFIKNLQTPVNEIEVQLTSFDNTSSTKLELENLLEALKAIRIEGDITVYTESQNIISLPERKSKLISKDYKNGKGVLLKNHLLYKEFFKLTKDKTVKFIKIKGHQPKGNKGELDKLFSIVDKASRKAIRSI